MFCSVPSLAPRYGRASAAPSWFGVVRFHGPLHVSWICSFVTHLCVGCSAVSRVAFLRLFGSQPCPTIRLQHPPHIWGWCGFMALCTGLTHSRKPSLGFWVLSPSLGLHRPPQLFRWCGFMALCWSLTLEAVFPYFSVSCPSLELQCSRLIFGGWCGFMVQGSTKTTNAPTIALKFHQRKQQESQRFT